MGSRKGVGERRWGDGGSHLVVKAYLEQPQATNDFSDSHERTHSPFGQHLWSPLQPECADPLETLKHYSEWGWVRPGSGAVKCLFKELTDPLRAQVVSDPNLVVLAAISDVASGALGEAGAWPQMTQVQSSLKVFLLMHWTQQVLGSPRVALIGFSADCRRNIQSP